YCTLTSSVFFSSSAATLPLPSFPTRRSSDLALRHVRIVVRLDLEPSLRLLGHQVGADERVQITVHHPVHVAHFELRAVVFEDERSEEHTSELQSPDHLVCRLLLEKKKTQLNS